MDTVMIASLTEIRTTPLLDMTPDQVTGLVDRVLDDGAGEQALDVAMFQSAI